VAYLKQSVARAHLEELELLARQAPIADLRLAPLRKDLAEAIKAEDEKVAEQNTAKAAKTAPKKQGVGQEDEQL
jgi:hypothetical protein